MHRDPSRTILIRYKLAVEITKKWNYIKREIVDYIRSNIKNTSFINNAENDEQISEFRLWLNFMMSKVIFENQQKLPFWYQKYIDTSYRRGSEKTFKLINKTDSITFLDPSTISYEKFSRERRLKVIYERNFNSLKNISDIQSNSITGALTNGIIRGDNPKKIAREISPIINNNNRRARLIARTEIIRTYNIATVDETERLSFLLQKNIKMMWITAGDTKVRDLHRSFDGKIYNVNEIKRMLDMSPYNCRCSLQPHIL